MFFTSLRYCAYFNVLMCNLYISLYNLCASFVTGILYDEEL